MNDEIQIELAPICGDQPSEVKTDLLILTEIESERFWSKISKDGNPGGCWLWTASTNNDGYGTAWLRKKPFAPHRMSYQMHHGPIGEGLCVMHSCDTRNCVNPSHLKLGTHQDNMSDMSEKGRVVAHSGASHYTALHPEKIQRGTSKAIAKLTNERVREMRGIYASGGITYAELGARFSVSKTAAMLAVKRRTWGHVI